MPSIRQQLRKAILERRGLETKRWGRVEPKVVVVKTLPKRDRRKTPMMLYIEECTGKDIEDLLVSGSLRKLAKQLNVEYTTLSKWRKRFGLTPQRVNPVVVPEMLDFLNEIEV